MPNTNLCQRKAGHQRTAVRVEKLCFLDLFEEFEGFEAALDVVIEEFAKDRFELSADRVRDLDTLNLLERQRAYMLDEFHGPGHDRQRISIIIKAPLAYQPAVHNAEFC